MKGFHLVFTHGVGPELSLNHAGEKLQNGEDTKHHLSITDVMYLGQDSLYDIFFAVNQLARVLSMP